MSKSGKSNGGGGFLVVLLLIVIVLLIMFGVGLGFGKGSGKGDGEGDRGKGDRNMLAEEVQDEAETKQEDTSVKDVILQKLEDSEENIVFKVNVVGNEYFYDNERIELSDLLLKLDDVSDEASVEVKDDNASLKAYNALINALEDKHITYTEK